MATMTAITTATTSMITTILDNGGDANHLTINLDHNLHFDR